LVLAVLALHAIAGWLAVGGWQRLAPAAAGVRRIAFVSVPQRASVPSAVRSNEAAGLPATAAAGVQTLARTGVTPARGRRPTGTGGARRGPPAGAREWPVYATQAPPSATLRYALVQGGPASAAGGSAVLDWQHDDRAFSLRLAVAVADRPPREWQSTGAFDAAGVAPQRLVERERGHDRRTITFDRASGRVRFSGASATPMVAPGVQDRWSWIAQLAAVAEAAARRGERPRRWDLQVAGLRGELERWTFQALPPGAPPPELEGNDVSMPGHRAPALLHVLRTAEQPYDLRIEAWLSPALHHLPAGLRMSTPPGPWSLSLWQRNS
jgi:hypothetical protein